MEEKLVEFIDIINTFDNTDEKREKLKNFICFFAEKLDSEIKTENIDGNSHKLLNDNNKNKEKTFYKNETLIKQLIAVASDMLKTFGYKSMAKVQSSNEFARDLVFDAIQNQHQSMVKEKKHFTLDGIQKKVIDKYFESPTNKRIFVSAPTSFGKSYILQEIIKRAEYNNIICVLPTVALLTEFTNRFSKLVLYENFSHKIITTNYDTPSDVKNIFIFTPERAIKFLGKSNIEIDFFFFDEVYKIDDGLQISVESKERQSNTTDDVDDKNLKLKNCRPTADNRAIAFRTCLYLLSKYCKDYYIAGPFISLDDVDNGLSRFIQKNDIRAIFIKFDPTLRVTYDAWIKKHIVEHNPIIEKLVEHIIPIQSKRKVPIRIEKFIRVKNFIEENGFGKSIVYLEYPSKVVELVNDYNAINKEDSNSNMIFEQTEQLKCFIEHLKNKYNVNYQIHKNLINSVDYWSIAECLSMGIGIHHGKIPKYVQNEILKQFDECKGIQFLFCTSTIIEGINTSAKNVVMVANARGKNEIQIFAQKNIKGRAGRYYKNFVGRVFYCNKEQGELEQDNRNVILDFINYADTQLTDIDLDITVIDDLSNSNKNKKQDREKQYNIELLPDNIFKQNMLFDRLLQQELLNKLLQKEYFDKFYNLTVKITNGNNEVFQTLLSDVIKIFLPVFDKTIRQKYINKILAIVSTYYKENFRGMLKYHLYHMSQNSKYKDIQNIRDDIDNKYNNVFNDIRTIIEYDVPKYISLFQSLFFRACQIKKKQFGESDLDTFIKQFEIGTRTNFGQFLIERGFPNTSITNVDNELSKSNIDIDNTKQSLDFIINNNYTLQSLDKYENIKLKEICSQTRLN